MGVFFEPMEGSWHLKKQGAYKHEHNGQGQQQEQCHGHGGHRQVRGKDDVIVYLPGEEKRKCELLWNPHGHIGVRMAMDMGIR